MPTVTFYLSAINRVLRDGLDVEDAQTTELREITVDEYDDNGALLVAAGVYRGHAIVGDWVSPVPGTTLYIWPADDNGDADPEQDPAYELVVSSVDEDEE